jgi:uncharacterized membrane protein YsdA (DUF1294 family)
MDWYKIFILSIIFIWVENVNLAAFALMRSDKQKAIDNEWRIPEATLTIVTFLGGGIGILVGTHKFHHKTRKKKFLGSVRVITAVEYLLLLGGIYYIVSSSI